MNIATALIARIEQYRAENKSPCKSYATQANAEKATKKVAGFVGIHHGCDQEANYIVVFNEAWGRWVGGIDLSELTRRPECMGGYLGLASQHGFYTY